jgi:KDO2-lipid IV(A) lauroyltransferase
MYYLFRFFYFLASLKLLSKLWWFFYLIDFKRKPIVKKNLSIAFPKKSKKEINKLAKKTYKNFLEHFEFIVALNKNPKLLNQVTIKNEELFKKAINSKKPLIIMSAHFGNWEIGPRLIAQKIPLAAVMREIENPKINKFFTKIRSNQNIKIIYKKRSAKEILKAMLKEKRAIGILIDQRTSNKQAPVVDFFVPTQFNPAISKLAKATNAIVLPAFSYKKEGKYVLEFKKPREFKDTTIEEFTQWQADVIKEMIINHPDEYYWFHDRWKNKV